MHPSLSTAAPADAPPARVPVQGFTKGMNTKSERWHGYIKDYDGGTLMQCEIHSEVDYLDIPGMVRKQRHAIVRHLSTLPFANTVYPALPAHTDESGVATRQSLLGVPGVGTYRCLTRVGEGS